MSNSNQFNPLVSIAMATHNGSEYLKMQLDSILNQSYKNIEIVIVDDASTDLEVIKILNQYVALNPNKIRLIQNAVNIGIIKTFEVAVSNCYGQFIAFSDQDDIWYPHKIQRLLDEIGDNLLIHSDAVLINDLGIKTVKSYMRAFKDIRLKSFSDYLSKNNVTGCTMMVSKELINLAKPFPIQHILHDYYLAIIASFYKRIKYIDEPLIEYRQHLANSVGARPLLSFDQFKLDCKKIAIDFDLLLAKPFFYDNTEIKLFRDFRYSIANGKKISGFNVYKFLLIKHGIKHLIYFYLMTGFGFGKLAKKFYYYFK